MYTIQHSHKIFIHDISTIQLSGERNILVFFFNFLFLLHAQNVTLGEKRLEAIFSVNKKSKNHEGQILFRNLQVLALWSLSFGQTRQLK